MFRVVKSPKGRGYAIKAPRPFPWVKGPGNTFGWYRRKEDAKKRADAFNRKMA